MRPSLENFLSKFLKIYKPGDESMCSDGCRNFLTDATRLFHPRKSESQTRRSYNCEQLLCRNYILSLARRMDRKCWHTLLERTVKMEFWGSPRVHDVGRYQGGGSSKLDGCRPLAFILFFSRNFFLNDDTSRQYVQHFYPFSRRICSKEIEQIISRISLIKLFINSY